MSLSSTERKRGAIGDPCAKSSTAKDAKTAKDEQKRSLLSLRNDEGFHISCAFQE